MFENKKLLQLLGSAVMAWLAVSMIFKSKEQSIETSYGMVEVLTAARDIPPHTLMSPDYLTTRRIPLKFLQPGAYMVKIPLEALRRVAGKVTIAAIPSGAQITQTDLTDPSSSQTGVAPLLPPGKRGYLLRLGNLDVADLLLPGDHVDVMATFTVHQKDNSTTKATYTILQNVLVVSVGKVFKQPNEDVTTKKDSAEGLNLTLALDPTESERMALAQAEAQGEISIVVRPHGENDIKPVPGVTPAFLFGNPTTNPAR